MPAAPHATDHDVTLSFLEMEQHPSSLLIWITIAWFKDGLFKFLHQPFVGIQFTILCAAAEHLSTGGLFIFDVWHSPAVHTQSPEVRVKRLEGEGISILRVAEPKIFPSENRVDVHYTVITRHLDTDSVYTFEENQNIVKFLKPL